MKNIALIAIHPKGPLSASGVQQIIEGFQPYLSFPDLKGDRWVGTHLPLEEARRTALRLQEEADKECKDCRLSIIIFPNQADAHPAELTRLYENHCKS